MIERPNPDQAALQSTALGDAVGDGLRALADLGSPAEQVTSGVLASELRALTSDLERGLGPALSPSSTKRVVAMMRVACAYLEVGDLSEARHALAVLDDSLSRPEQRPGDPGSATGRAGPSSAARKRTLRRRGIVEGAVGVLVAHGGGSPHDALALLRSYAVGRGDALLDLAEDVVAGRVDPGRILGPPRREDQGGRPSGFDGPATGDASR